MSDLDQMKCEVCRVGAPAVTDDEIAKFLPQIPEWTIVERDDVKRIERAFKFQNFAEALAFTNKVGELAEVEGHHPSILTQWGRAKVAWWTHKIMGLHQNDFVMAARTDELYGG